MRSAVLVKLWHHSSGSRDRRRGQHQLRRRGQHGTGLSGVYQRGRHQTRRRRRSYQQGRILVMLYDVAAVGAVLQRHPEIVAVVTQPCGFRVARDGRHRRPGLGQHESDDGRGSGTGNGGRRRVRVAAHDSATANGFHLNAR